jgi:acetyl esterase
MSTAVESPLVIEPATEAWLASLAVAGGPPIYELTPEAARAVLRSAQASVAVDLERAELEERTIPGGPSGSVGVRIYRPGRVFGRLPVVVHAHGGGWILGDENTHERLDRELANAAGAIVVFVKYTPAPEAQYPTQNEETYAVFEWLARNAAEIGADPARVALVGDSVGGNMVAALTLMSAERRGPRATAQVLFYPVTGARFDTESYERYADGPWLTRAAMRWFWDAYLPDESRRSEATASPLEAPAAQLAGAPPTLVVNGEHDVLRDEGEAYARKLVQAGIRVTAVRYAGTIHDFVLLNPIARTPAPRAAIAQAAAFLRESFAD